MYPLRMWHFERITISLTPHSVPRISSLVQGPMAAQYSIFALTIWTCVNMGVTQSPLMDVHDISDPFFCYFFKFRLFLCYALWTLLGVWQRVVDKVSLNPKTKILVIKLRFSKKATKVCFGVTFMDVHDISDPFFLLLLQISTFFMPRFMNLFGRMTKGS